MASLLCSFRRITWLTDHKVFLVKSPVNCNNRQSIMHVDFVWHGKSLSTWDTVQNTAHVPAGILIFDVIKKCDHGTTTTSSLFAVSGTQPINDTHGSVRDCTCTHIEVRHDPFFQQIESKNISFHRDRPSTLQRWLANYCKPNLIANLDATHASRLCNFVIVRVASDSVFWADPMTSKVLLRTSNSGSSHHIEDHKHS